MTWSFPNASTLQFSMLKIYRGRAIQYGEGSGWGKGALSNGNMQLRAHNAPYTDIVNLCTEMTDLLGRAIWLSSDLQWLVVSRMNMFGSEHYACTWLELPQNRYVWLKAGHHYPTIAFRLLSQTFDLVCFSEFQPWSPHRTEPPSSEPHTEQTFFIQNPTNIPCFPVWNWLNGYHFQKVLTKWQKNWTG